MLRPGNLALMPPLIWSRSPGSDSPNPTASPPTASPPTASPPTGRHRHRHRCRRRRRRPRGRQSAWWLALNRPRDPRPGGRRAVWRSVWRRAVGARALGRLTCLSWGCAPTARSSCKPTLGLEDGVVAANTVRLEGLGGLVVMPIAALGEVAEGEPSSSWQGHHRTTDAVATGPQRVGERVPIVEVADH